MTMAFPEGVKNSYVPNSQPQGGQISKQVADVHVWKRNEINNWKHTRLNDTQAANEANSLADGQDAKGNPTISAEKFKAYCHEHFPHADLTNVDNMTNYITVEDATGSLTTYYIQEQTATKKEEFAQLKESVDTPVQEQPPQMGL